MTQPQPVIPPGAQTGTLDDKETGSQPRAATSRRALPQVPRSRVGLGAISPILSEPPASQEKLRASYRALREGFKSVSAICLRTW